MYTCTLCCKHNRLFKTRELMRIRVVVHDEALSRSVLEIVDDLELASVRYGCVVLRALAVMAAPRDPLLQRRVPTFIFRSPIKHP